MKLFSEVKIGETFVVAGGFVLVKSTDTTAVFSDAENVGEIPHEPSMETYTQEEFNSLPYQPIEEAFNV